MKVLTGQNNKDGNIWLAAGAETEAFEQEFAKYVGVNYAIFTNSCTSALKMAYKWALELKYNFFLYPKNTFCATYSACDEMGGNPIAEEELDQKWKEDTNCHKGMAWYEQNARGKNKYIKYELNLRRINVHFGGVKDETPCLIEDSAHRIEPNDPLIGKIRCYSFYATKNMTTGSGGMLVTDDKKIYERCRLYWRDGLSTSTYDRHHGKGYNYKVKVMAGGYDGNDIAAAIGRVQLRKLPEFTKRRNEIVDRYNKAFGKDWKGNHLYSYSKDKELIDYLKKQGISAGYFYPPDGFVCLPLYPSLTDEEVDYIIQKTKEAKCKF
jgi:dTDP-4-amino-4,6-dideoxygalactose transaminase